MNPAKPAKAQVSTKPSKSTTARSGSLKSKQVAEKKVKNAELTPQQEKFCQCIVSGMNQSDAYRASYNVRPNTKPESVNTQAGTLMADLKIACRVKSLRKPVVEALQLTREWVLRELIENVQMAKSAIPVRTADGETGEYKQELPAANKALELLGKELGMFVDRKIIDLTTHEETLDELA